MYQEHGVMTASWSVSNTITIWRTAAGSFRSPLPLAERKGSLCNLWASNEHKEYFEFWKLSSKIQLTGKQKGKSQALQQSHSSGSQKHLKRPIYSLPAKPKFCPVAAHHIGLPGSPQPQKQRDWLPQQEKPVQLVEVSATGGNLLLPWSPLRLTRRRGVLGGWGSGEGSAMVSCPDSSSRADNTLKFG